VLALNALESGGLCWQWRNWVWRRLAEGGHAVGSLLAEAPPHGSVEELVEMDEGREGWKWRVEFTILHIGTRESLRLLGFIFNKYTTRIVS
jgi:hypothetical protein